MAQGGSLLRPSQLARFWEVHPKTVNEWIRTGRLVAIRTPGTQFRVRPADVRDFCAQAEMAVPPFAMPLVKRVFLVGGAASARATKATRHAVERALEGLEETAVESFASAFEGLFAAVRAPPAVLALDVSTTGDLDVNDAFRALRASPGAEGVALVAFNVATPARAEVLLRSGATRALVKKSEPALAIVLRELLR